MRRNIGILLLTIIMIGGFSTCFFGFKAKAQSNKEEVFCKYYKSVAVTQGDTLWNYAKDYADSSFYGSYDSYISEVMDINHLKNDKIVCGQHIILPYYSSRPQQEPSGV